MHQLATTLAQLRQHPTVAVVRSANAQQAVQQALTLAQAGYRSLELTFTTPQVGEAFVQLQAALQQQYPGQAFCLGLGSMHTPQQVEEALALKPQFVASAGSLLEAIPPLHQAGILYFPGILTPTELLAAQRAGAVACKLFPAQTMGGAAYVKALGGPFPTMGLFACGGISPQQVPEYLAAGALAVGLGRSLLAQ